MKELIQQAAQGIIDYAKDNTDMQDPESLKDLKKATEHAIKNVLSKAYIEMGQHIADTRIGMWAS